MESIVLSETNHESLGLKSSKPMYKHRRMVNDEIANRIFCGAVECKPVIQQLNKRSVKFVDGTVVDDVDAIICATGYNVTCPYLDNDIVTGSLKVRELYLYVFPPRLKMHTLALIGFCVDIGGTGPVLEMQARWIRYKDRIADFIGAKPNFWKLLLTDPKLAYAVMFGPCYPATYRLTGPGVWEKARETVMNAQKNTQQESLQFFLIILVIVVVSLPLFALIKIT
uniref:Flavin-containing monooxygenase n=1 Tax=Saccoglossus kowalevskii TaxID=10224 RepID=A0ABM0M4U2_SACKO|nr:PREDICTED: dimethylaniline monooxygenase [N-oxide-forming] 2-like [Saccoglossus kowalevskii]